MSSKTKRNLLYAFKVSAVAIIAIIIAECFRLRFAVSAGIVAILSVAYTKKETLKTALNRLFAFAAALVIAAVCFGVFGFNNYGFFMYLVVFIFVCQFMKWNSAMAMDSVLISHFISFGEINIRSLVNETGLFIIGVGLGVIVNIFLRQNTGYMRTMKEETDELIRTSLHRMSLRITNPQMPGYDGSCFEKLNATILDAAAQARENYMNQVSKDETEDMKYIAMRERQIAVLYEMYKDLSKIKSVPVSADALASFFEQVSISYSEENTAEELLSEYEKLDKNMKQMPLPTEREEFEDRARLFSVMKGMEEFLIIKRDYMGNRR